MFVYRFTKNHVPGETVFPSRGEAVRQAVRDMDSGEIYPREILEVTMDRNAIEAEWEQKAA